MKNKKNPLSLIATILVMCFFLLLPSMARPQAGTMTVGVGDGAGFPGSEDNPVEISLENLDAEVKGMSLDLCRGDDLVLSACGYTERTQGFFCEKKDQENGCDRIILIGISGGSIAPGTGPIITLTYDIASGAPPGTCQDLTLAEVKISDPPDAVVTEPGEFCFKGGTTTTTTVPASYTVAVIPSAATLSSGGSYQFSARTTFNGEEVDGTYLWEIVPGSTIGSSIDVNGLFTAGENTTEAGIEETVRVTDTAHGNKTATANITIRIKQVTPECTITIDPLPASVHSGGSLTLSARTEGEVCEPGEYEWDIVSEIGSQVDQEGNYTAGINDTDSPVNDQITVVDHANGDITGTATITVEREGAGNTISIVPAQLLGNPWVPWLYLLWIRGEGAGFNARSLISFDPGDDIVHLFHVGFGNTMFAFIILRANPLEGPVGVTVTTEGEEVRGELSIKALFPLPAAGR